MYVDLHLHIAVGDRQTEGTGMNRQTATANIELSQLVFQSVWSVDLKTLLIVS